MLMKLSLLQLFLLVLRYCAPKWLRVVQGQTALFDPIWGWTLLSSEIAQTSFLMAGIIPFVYFGL